MSTSKQNRVGRPRKNPMDRQEFFGVFARMSTADREFALTVMQSVHDALSDFRPSVPENLGGGQSGAESPEAAQIQEKGERVEPL